VDGDIVIRNKGGCKNDLKRKRAVDDIECTVKKVKCKRPVLKAVEDENIDYKGCNRVEYVNEDVES